MLAADPEVAAAFAGYLARYGHRCLSYEVADPTLAERPEIVLELVRCRLDTATAGSEAAVADRGERVAAQARALLAGRDPADRERFERTLARALRAYPVREDNEHATVSVPLALLRRAVLEVGRRLAERGQLTAADDVVFLEPTEVSAALPDGTDRRRWSGAGEESGTGPSPIPARPRTERTPVRPRRSPGCPPRRGR